MTNSGTPSIEVSHFHMFFGSKQIINDLSFSVQPGETFGFLGGNGSGKTTTIRALLGLYEPTAGTLHIHGKPFTPNSEVQLGYLPEERGLYTKENTLEVMIYFGTLKGMNRQAARDWSRTYLERVQLEDKEKTRIEKLSSGQQQKIQLGITLMNSPQLLILDETTKGFDPVNRKLLLEIIAECKKNGATIMMVTHHMEEVERLCERIILLKNGSAHAYGTIPEIKHQFGSTLLRVDHEHSLPASALYTITTHTSAPTVAFTTPHTRSDLNLTAGVSAAEVLTFLIGQGVRVHRCEPITTSLDEIFLNIYGADASTSTQPHPEH